MLLSSMTWCLYFCDFLQKNIVRGNYTKIEVGYLFSIYLKLPSLGVTKNVAIN